MKKEIRTSAVDRDGATLVIGDEVIVLKYKEYMYRSIIVRFTPQMIVAKRLENGEIIKQMSHYVMKAGNTQTVWNRAKKSMPKKAGTYLVRYEHGFCREMCWNSDISAWENPWENGHTSDIVQWAEMPK